MATEELNSPPLSTAYPQIIMEAIESLKETEGANKSTITKFMESKYGVLAPNHADLLLNSLNQMKDLGEIHVVNNNYFKPGPDSPQKRGRGRPPKEKEVPPPGSVVAASSSPRPRGRPRKDPNAPPAAKKPKLAADPLNISKTGRPRGRPKKVQQPQSVQNGVEA